MTIHLKPDLEAILRAQVAAGNFASIEEALEAAILGLAADAQEPDGDLSWAKPYLAEAEADIAAGRTVGHEDVWARINQRFGKR